jgi:hypothetical protein
MTVSHNFTNYINKIVCISKKTANFMASVIYDEDVDWYWMIGLVSISGVGANPIKTLMIGCKSNPVVSSTNLTQLGPIP